MKKWLLVPLFLLPTLAAADPIDPNPDGIGIYADLQGRINQVDLEDGEAMEVYVLITRPSMAGLEESQFAGAEFRIVMPDNVSLWGWNAPMPGSLVFSNPPDFMFALQYLQPYTEAMHVLTLIIQPTDGEPAQFYLTAHSRSAAESPQYMYYYSDEFLLYELTPYPGGCDNMVFVVNGQLVPGEERSWSDVKALYR